MMGSESDASEGVTQEDLDRELKDVRNKRGVIMIKSKMKSKLKARRKIAKVSDMIEHFESKGIEVNKESLRARSKSRKSITELEDAKDRLAKAALDSEDEGDVVMDKKMAAKEAETRGRKRRRERSPDTDDLMDVDEN